MFLAGGGSPTQEARVWRGSFAGASTILYWPFALPDERIPAAAGWFIGALVDQGITADVTTWESLDDHRSREIADFDVIAVGGGLTSKLAGHIRAHQFDEPLADYIRAGGTYYGGSAGAILPCAEITLAGLIEDDPASADAPGLGVLRDAAIFPHADTYPRELAAQLASRLGYDLIALAEDSGVRVDGTELTAIGPGVVRRTRTDGSTTTMS